MVLGMGVDFYRMAVKWLRMVTYSRYDSLKQLDRQRRKAVDMRSTIHYYPRDTAAGWACLLRDRCEQSPTSSYTAQQVGGGDRLRSRRGGVPRQTE